MVGTFKPFHMYFVVHSLLSNTIFLSHELPMCNYNFVIFSDFSEIH